MNGFDGAVLLISHDRHLVEACVDRLWIVEQGDVQPFDGDLEDYKTHLMRERAGERASKRENKNNDKKASRQSGADIRLKLAPHKRSAEKAEAKLNKLTKIKEQIETELTDQTLYEVGVEDRLKALTLRSAKATIDIEAAEDEWLAAEQKYEEMKAQYS